LKGAGLAATNGKLGDTTIPLRLRSGLTAGNLVAGRMTNIGRVTQTTAVMSGFRPSSKGARLAVVNDKQGDTTILLCFSIGVGAGNLVAGRMTNIVRILHHTAVMAGFRPYLKGARLAVANGKQSDTTILLCLSIELTADNLVASQMTNLGCITQNTAVMTGFRPSLALGGLMLVADVRRQKDGTTTTDCADTRAVSVSRIAITRSTGRTT
jgi:hypothetical protein